MPYDFIPDAPTWSPENAAFLCLASTYAYEKRSAILAKKVRETLGMAICTPFSEGDTQGYVASNDTAILIAFRGTEPENIKDWMTDADISPLPFRYVCQESRDIGLIHTGFGQAFRVIWRSLPQMVDALQNPAGQPQKALWITGHSLGGALAVLCAAGFLFDGTNRRPVAGCYTYGQPRVGDEIFAAVYNHHLKEKTYRVVNYQDPVTRVPPRVLDVTPAYSDTGRLVYLDSFGGTHGDTTGWDTFLKDVLVGVSIAQKFPIGVADIIKNHDLSGYQSKLEKYIADIKTNAQKALTW